MVKFLKPNKAMIILQGLFASQKAVIVKNFDDGTHDRSYGDCLVAGIYKYPKKLVNYNHIMPTHYILDVDLKDMVTPNILPSKDKKVTACKETKARFEECFKTGNNKWFFTKLSHGLRLDKVPYQTPSAPRTDGACVTFRLGTDSEEFDARLGGMEWKTSFSRRHDGSV
ncbi:hypothetical protein Taro_053705 [Colocasia esculenta]|uniref:60S ribosomal protein L27 n=1 Tax=Colocasia esculenta TaxID=4460 RepID=A0A843XNF3_COLES|nr:hypothetical protein [Colocasia esculenta]